MTKQIRNNRIVVSPISQPFPTVCPIFPLMAGGGAFVTEALKIVLGAWRSGKKNNEAFFGSLGHFSNNHSHFQLLNDIFGYLIASIG